MKSECLVVIPARLDSVRLPGKLLLPLGGYPLIYWTYHAAKRADVGEVLVATDSSSIIDALEELDIPWVQTTTGCRNGTERVFEVAKQYEQYERFINVQGDEPRLNHLTIQSLAAQADYNETFNVAISATTDPADASEVKVALTKGGEIKFASRAPIPYARDDRGSTFYKIHGVYAYSISTLERFVMADEGPLEQIEKVEQLRCIENGIKLKGIITPPTPKSVDTEIDYEMMRSFF